MASVAEPTRSSPEATRAPAGTDPGSRLERAIGAVERRHLWVLGVLLALDGALLLYMGRGLTFFFDDWDFVTHDYGGGLHSLLAAHGGNISILPVAVYKVLFHLVGLDHYAIFRLVVIVLHLTAGTLVYVLAVRRMAAAPALLAAALVLFLGAAWEDLLWAFQVGYLLSIVGGLTAWLMLERRDQIRGVAAMAALVVAVGSSSLGIPLVVGAAFELAWRREWRRGWIVIVPAVLYLIWYLGYGESQITSASLINAPGFAADLAAAAVGAVVGRSLDWGRPLALLGVFAVLWRSTRPIPVSGRFVGLLATGLSLWIVTAATRSTISAPETSRYVYLGAVVVVLLGVELLLAVVPSPRAIAIGAVLVLYFALCGLTAMHDGASGLRATSQTLTAELGAMELAAPNVPPSYQPDSQRAPQIRAGPYLHTVASIGSSPADSPAQIVASDAGAKTAADSVLVALGLPKVTVSVRRPSALAPAPSVVGVVSAKVGQRGACVALTPLPGTTLFAAITFPPGGGTINDRGRSPVALAVKRFGEAFVASATSVAPGAEVEVAPPTDAAAAVPWQVQVSSTAPVLACGLLP